MSEQQAFSVKAIGTVRAGEEGFSLEIDPAYAAALNGLEGFGHVNVLWWGHQWDAYREILECDRPYKAGPAKMGIFATRSPVRPNPILLTTAAVLGIDRERGVVRIAYIDAEDGTPILDLKPYHPAEDRVRDVAVPAWCAHWPQWQEDSATFDWSAEFENAQ